MVACLPATPRMWRVGGGAIAGSDLCTQRTAVTHNQGEFVKEITGLFFAGNLSGPLFFRVWENKKKKKLRQLF